MIRLAVMALVTLLGGLGGALITGPALDGPPLGIGGMGTRTRTRKP